MTIYNLDYFFNPKSIAIIGSGTMAHARDATLLRNLISAGCQGPVMPVNPDHPQAGVLTYNNVAELPLNPDLAVITTPLDGVPTLIRQLGERGTRAVALLNERLPEDLEGHEAELRQAILDAAKPYTLRILGPGCLGVAAPLNRLNATLSSNPLIPGTIAFVSQSRAVMRGVLDWASSREIGFSKVVSLGAGIDVDFGDLLDYMAQDNPTHSILLYLENVRDTRKFMSAARIAARIKPVLVLKPRYYHHDPLEDAVYDAAFRRAGILRVSDIEQLFYAVHTLSTVKPVKDDRLAIMGNSRSLSLLARETLERAGGRLAALSQHIRAELAGITELTVGNPVDLGDYAPPEIYGKVLARLLSEPAVDAILVLHATTTPEQDMAIARMVSQHAAHSQRLVLTSWVGGDSTKQVRRLFKKQHIATYANPSDAILAFTQLAQHARNQILLMETPPSIPVTFTVDHDEVHQIIKDTLAANRNRLNAFETMTLLRAYDIPVVETYLAKDPEQAAAIAEALGCSVALKIVSPDIHHKSDVGGVIFDLKTSDQVIEAATVMLEEVRTRIGPEGVIDGFLVQPMQTWDGAYEIAIGVRTSPHFGPVLSFGHGGTETDVINDLAYTLPPLNIKLARDLMSRTRIYSMLNSHQGRSADLSALALTLIKVSQMVIDLEEIVTLDINPLWADRDGVIALDADIHIAPSPYSPAARRLAIRPYPKELEQHITLPDGRHLLLRPVLPEDEPAVQQAVHNTPAEDLRLRFFQPIKELSHTMAARLTQLDYDREMALAMTEPGTPGKANILGVVRIMMDPDMQKAEYAIIMNRGMKGQGLGPLMMRRIIDYARQRGIREIYGEVLRENRAMLKLNRALGFKVKPEPDDPSVMRVTLDLSAQSVQEE